MFASSSPDIEDAYPLAPMQTDMLVHSMSSPGSGAYLQHAICDLREPLEPARLEAAWQAIVARHPILRTTFHLERDAVQQVHRHVDVPWIPLDWRDVQGEQQETRFDAHVEADRRRDFALEGAPMRIALFRLGDAHYRLLWTYHHALLDGRSVRVVLRELFDLYDALIAGRDLAFPTLRPYRGYIDWLERQDASCGTEAYWRNTLQGLTALTPLPVERAHSDAGDDEGHAISELALPRESTDALRRFADEHGLTLNTLLLGAWAQLLGRYSGEADVVFDTTLALRGDRADDMRDIVGLCINTVPMRVRVEPEMPLLAWLEGLRAQWRAMRPHAWFPLASIHRCSRGARAERASSSLVVFEHASLDTLLHEDRKEWRTRTFARRSTPHQPLTLACFGERELLLKLAYARSRYEASTVAAMLEHLRNLLEGAIGASGRPLREQPLLARSERRRILVEWNDTARNFSTDCGVHELVTKQAARTPDAVAVESPRGCLTYGELEERSNQLAWHLAKRGVGPDALVGLCVPRTPELLIGLLGILKAGGAYLPLDPGHPPARLEGILRDAVVATLVTTQELGRRLGKAGEGAVLLDAQQDEIARESTWSRDARVAPDQLAYVVYTSGSSGRPKGISVPHIALANHTLALAEKYAISPADRRLQFVSIGADVLIADVFPVLISGGVVVLRPDGELISVAEFLRFLEARKITMTGIPSAYWHEWVDAIATGEAPPLPSSLRVVVCGMDTVRVDAFAAWRKHVGKRLRWVNAYGPSETTCTATTYEADLASDSGPAPIPIGRPIANVRVYVLDRYANPVPVGVPGEICIGGRGVSLGYRNRPDLTAESFVRDPFSDDPAGRMYRTGDLARYLPDGNIEFLGRMDSQIKIRGYRVEPAEVESALRRLACIRDAVVTGQGAAGEPRKLVGYVVATDPGFDMAEVRRELRASLPGYMVPAVIVVLDALPRTANGKIDYAALPEAHAPAADTESGEVPPRDALERAIAKIWQDVLGVPKIGIGEHFFDLGGDSLLAVRMLSTVARAHGVEIPFYQFLAQATIDGLAGTLRTMIDSRSMSWGAGGALGSPGAAIIDSRPRRELPQSELPGIDS